MKYLFSFLVVLAAFASSTNAALVPATWVDATHGDLLGSNTSIDVVSSGNVAVLTSGPFGPGQWEASMPLTDSLFGLTVDAEVNTYQTFTFDSPLADGTLMYIEDLDTSAIAEFNVYGAGSATLIDSSSSISMMGNMITSSNATQNGEGDLLFQLDGGVTMVSIGYHSLGSATDVNFTFAEASHTAVPEPGSAAVMAGLFGLGALAYVRRRNK